MIYPAFKKIWAYQIKIRRFIFYLKLNYDAVVFVWNKKIFVLFKIV